MHSDPSHNRIIMLAAKSALGSIGCLQKGRSRVWLDDHGWWLGVVEFQPSSWVKGSYLNVAATFLWRASGVLSFDCAVDDNSRKQSFHEFEEAERFEQIAQRLSELAATEVKRLRSQFCSIQAAAAVLGRLPGSPVYCHYHAAVAAALAGDLITAEAQFARLAKEREPAPWVRTLQTKAALFAEALYSPDRLRELVGLEVEEARRMLKLPPLPLGCHLWESG